MADNDGMGRVLLIAVKGSLDRLDALLSERSDFSDVKWMAGKERAVLAKDLKAIRDDLWTAWFELKDRVK